MPRLIAKVEGKGNGIKTVIPNMGDIARAIGRPPTYPTKFFGCELGAQTQFDVKNDRYIVNGSHDATKLQDLLYTFIEKFVLCEGCENPETILKVNSKRNLIQATCKACGYNYTLDSRHKLTPFILKNPPEQSLKASGTSLTERKEKRSKRRENSIQEDSQTETKPSSDDSINEDDEIDWSTDISEEAVKERLKQITELQCRCLLKINKSKELSAKVKGLALDDDLDMREADRVDLLLDFIKAKLLAGSISMEDEKDIVSEACRLNISNKAPIVLCELLLVDKILTQIKQYKRLFLRFTIKNQKAQKYLIGGIEKTIEARQEELLPKVPSILKTLYDEDILDEDVLLEWGKKASKKYICKDLSEQIHKKAESFLKWLKEAEEESDDASDVELEFDERAKISTLIVKVEGPGSVQNNTYGERRASNYDPDSIDDDEEDIDIDGI